MKRDEQDRLLGEIISSEELADFRRASLVHGLAAVQRRNHRRRMVRTGAMLIAPALVALALFFGRRQNVVNNPDSVRSANLAVNPPPSVPTTEGPAPIKVINDDELLALFPDRSLALLGPPGNQQLVFLDKAKKQETRRSL
jgi:hypothetical protein